MRCLQGRKREKAQVQIYTSLAPVLPRSALVTQFSNLYTGKRTLAGGRAV